MKIEIKLEYFINNKYQLFKLLRNLPSISDRELRPPQQGLLVTSTGSCGHFHRDFWSPPEGAVATSTWTFGHLHRELWPPPH